MKCIVIPTPNSQLLSPALKAHYDLPTTGGTNGRSGGTSTRVTAVIDESVLYRVVGSPAVLLRQLNHLLELSQRPNVIIQIVRSPNRYYAGLESWLEIATGRDTFGL